MKENNGRRQMWQRLRRPAWLGTLRRVTPLSSEWGYERGTPVDRYYIEQFMNRHRGDIRGRVLEVRDSTYTDRFGTGVVQRDVLDLNPDNPRATLVADLTAADSIPDNLFDCFVLTQTLQFIYDVRAALGHIQRILRPGGVLLLTVPSVSRVAPRYGLETDYWRFTAASCMALLEEAFGPGQAAVESYGNVLAGIAFLAGMAREELSARELAAHDPFFPLVIAARAIKSGSR
jgi:SAM-dependent methyltransferase